MFVRTLAVGIAIAAASHTAGGQPAAKYRYLIDATNAIVEVTGQSTSPNREVLEKVSVQSCRALEQLLKDDAFRGDLKKMAKHDAKTRAETARMKRELSLFLAAFLRVEENSLRAAGLSNDAVKQISWSAAMFQRALEDDPDPNRILVSMEQLRSDLCASAQKFAALKNDDERVALLRKWGFRLGGVALIIVDVTSSAPTGGVAIGSVAIGTAVAGWNE